MLGSALDLPFFETPGDDARDGFRAFARDLARSRGAGRPRTVAELQALAELGTGPFTFTLPEVEGFASGAHRAYRGAGHLYRDVRPLPCARSLGLVLVPEFGGWISRAAPDLGMASIRRREDRMAETFDGFHELAELITARDLLATHADRQLVTVALMVEQRVASRALRAFGVVAGTAFLARSHRHVRRCFLTLRLVLCAVQDRAE